MTRGPLAGIGVLVTRPVHQAKALEELIRGLGGEPLLFPALEIEALDDRLIAITPERLAGFDYAIFASPNAARIAMAHVRAIGGMPARLRVAAIGPATTAELERAGLKKNGSREIITADTGFDSEALLQVLPPERVAGKRVVIFRGEGGRKLLGDTLRSRGSEVEYVECYRRVRPGGDMRAALSRWQRGQIGASIATSAEIVVNLFEMAGETGRPQMCQTPMFVPHPRVAAAGFRLGVTTLIVSGGGDEALASGLETWFGRLLPVRHLNSVS